MKTSFKIVIVFFLISFIARSQNTSVWTKEELSKANTGLDANYLTNSEKQVLLILNLARVNPKKFANTYLKTYADSTKKGNNSYVKSLRSDLLKIKELMPLIPKKDLFEAAQLHAIAMGKTGKVGHDDFEKRTLVHRQKYIALGENCDYGYDNPLTIAMRFLIDEGVSDQGHRKNVLSSDYLFVGISIRPHKKYKYNCVVDFGGKEK